MSDFNPYQSPAAPINDQLGAGGAQGEIPPEVMTALAQTRPWVTFLGILGFIGTGLFVLIGLVMAVAGMATGAPKLSPALGIVYALLGAIYFFPSYFLVRYGSAIRRLVVGGGMPALAEAVTRQKSFWRLSGIMALVVMSIYALVLVGGIIIGASGMMK